MEMLRFGLFLLYIVFVAKVYKTPFVRLANESDFETFS